MSAAEFLTRMERCSRVSDLMNLFNAHWHSVTGTFDEMVDLRFIFSNRLDELTKATA